ncbi:MAG: 50S ribosomal protein L29 [Candidatus Harrisonbacteria bacterium]|nr:50S ribosomal protein L29 [Candidatus Harrisonbacteria bacterium]
MKKKDFEKMKHRSSTELSKELTERREKLWNIQQEIANGKEKDVKKGQKMRREIAQLETLLSVKGIEEEAKK